MRLGTNARTSAPARSAVTPGTPRARCHAEARARRTIFRMRTPFHVATASCHSPPGFERSSSSNPIVASTVASHTPTVVGGVDFSTRTASCRAHGDSASTEGDASVGGDASGTGSAMSPEATRWHTDAVTDSNPAGLVSGDLLPSELARFEEVCRFGQDRLEPLALTVARAFREDPIWQWVYDDDQLDTETALPLARAFVASTSPLDEIHGFRHHGAVALWRAPLDQVSDAHHEHVAAQSGRHWAAVGEQVGARMAALGEFGAAARAARPTESHWYLQIIGVDPDHQSQGLGGRVLAPMLTRSDRLGIPLYLESSNPRNHSFYRRLGFVETEEVAAAGSPPMLGFFRSSR